MTIILDIVSQHAEEAAFLWLLRSNAIYQPHYALKDLAKLDDRVEAHLGEEKGDILLFSLKRMSAKR